MEVPAAAKTETLLEPVDQVLPVLDSLEVLRHRRLPPTALGVVVVRVELVVTDQTLLAALAGLVLPQRFLGLLQHMAVVAVVA